MVAKNEEIIGNLKSGVIKFDEEMVIKNCNIVIETGMDIKNAILEGLTMGMREVGDLYEKEVYSIPEVLLSAQALESGLSLLKPYLKGEEKINHNIIIGTVEGDIHNIGKNMVKLMLEVGGFNVIDLGVDVSEKVFLDALEKDTFSIVALSTMMTTTLPYMKKIIDAVRSKYPQIKIIVGGASVTKETAKAFEADGFGESAVEAVTLANKILDIN
jgi:methanogenic corrinoid protein MtbC1